MLLFVLCWSCSEEPETTEKPGPHVVAWNDTTFTGDATMSMKFSVGWGGMNIEQSAATLPFGQGGFTTRVATQMDGTATFSVGDLIAIAVTKTGGSEEVKPYIVKSDGSLEYAGTDSDPFIWRSTTETASVRAWSYGSTADLAYLTTAPETRDYTIEADQQTNGYLELLYCKPQATGFSSSPISLSFYHQLSRVIFNVEQELSGTLPVSSVSVGNASFPLVASFTLPTGDSNFGTWTTDGTTYGTLTPKEETAQSGYDHTYSAVVFPGTYAKNSKLFTLTNSDGSYIYTITDAAGQTLTTSNQYTYTISVKNKLIFKNPLWWVAQYNLAEDGTSFVTEHSTTSQYLFDYNDAMSANIQGYHVPSHEEQVSIIPSDKLLTSGTDIFSISTYTLNNPYEFSETASNIGGTTVAASTSVFGKNADYDYYAVRFINTPYCSAWHYIWATSPTSGLLIESYLLDGIMTLEEAKAALADLASSTTFTKSAGAVTANQTPETLVATPNCYVQRFLPACGDRNYSGVAQVAMGTSGFYRSSTSVGDNAYNWGITKSFLHCGFGGLTSGNSVRLFKDAFTRKAASSLTIDDISAYTYDGTAKEPTPAVRDGSTLLTKDVDYQLSYTNNINAGTATLTLKGIGAFTGTTTKTFTINKAASTMSNASGAVSFTASQGANSTLSRTITCTNCSVSDASVTSGSGFSISRSGNTITITRTNTATISDGVISVTGTASNSNYNNSNITIAVSATAAAGVALAAASDGDKVCSDGKVYNPSATVPGGVSDIGMVAYKSGTSGIVMYKQDNSGTYTWANRNNGNPSAVNVYVSNLSSTTSKSWTCGTRAQYENCGCNGAATITLQNRLESAGCSKIAFNINNLWTATESDSSNAYYYSGGGWVSYAKYASFLVRAIFAF